MLKITVDVFSGRPNPTWIMDDKRGDDLLKKISRKKQIISKSDKGYNGLGFRGIKLELLGDETSSNKLPSTFKIADGLAKDQKASIDLAKEIVDQMTRYERANMDVFRLTPIDKRIQKVILGSIEQYERDLKRIQKYIRIKIRWPISPIRVTVKDSECSSCKYEESRFNPDFWNADPYVRANNNCYNYGRNWKTNTFAQPGRHSGATASSMSCSAVKTAAMNDGLVERCDCLPHSEYPRRLMALVIAPGIDYHWYRKQTGGFWGHKPGGTAARNYDNSGVLIVDPQTCDRGAGTYLNYTDFCGFFYAGKSVVIS
jgi:hypothetical protein